MAAQQADSSYERLETHHKLKLPDAVAQSIGFMGPVFSSAFVIPLVVGVISASGKGGGVASPLSVLLAAVGVFALGWIAQRFSVATGFFLLALMYAGATLSASRARSLLR